MRACRRSLNRCVLVRCIFRLLSCVRVCVCLRVVCARVRARLIYGLLRLGVHFLTAFDRNGIPQAKLLKDVPTYKLITTSVVSERLKVTGSLARVAIRILCEKGLIKPVSHSSAMLIYTRATAIDE